MRGLSSADFAVGLEEDMVVVSNRDSDCETTVRIWISYDRSDRDLSFRSKHWDISLFSIRLSVCPSI